MRRGLAVALLFAACTGTAFAAAYDDFSRGISANFAGNNDLAIQSFTSALSAGDLAEAYVPQAHLGRARAYLAKGKCAEALADLDETLKTKTADALPYMLRAEANICLRKVDEAQKDFAAAVGLRPEADFFWSFARNQWFLGRFSDAAENFAQAGKHATKDDTHRPYYLLWQALSAERAGTLDHAAFASAVSALDLDDWPEPILEFYKGTLSAENVYRKAASRDSALAGQQKCEADFYIGEWHLAHKNVADAKTLLQQAADSCPHNFVEANAAKAELKRLQ